MRLTAPTTAPPLELTDLQGRPLALAGSGRRILLSFFRDGACPFCNLRIVELTRYHDGLHSLGLDVIAVFGSSERAVRRFVAARPRPFRIAADPAGSSHLAYGIQRSLFGKLRAIATRVPSLLRGLRLVGLAGLDTNNLMPADFLIDEQGRIVEAYYGVDAGDRIPLERIELFAARGLLQRGPAGSCPPPPLAPQAQGRARQAALPGTAPGTRAHS